ncbi:short-chain dehydrogenase [Gordonia spumicola]|uniref:Short-chain dehydrogenase n=1 Tax=Gordonia spumicola TaxID=589161 RepID=A0A7I9VCC7_9ACTN|nr:oxidoreductase [Gordonia spumicola]GEE03028.1 short-chain dehydrogenase [Gordonia spumicola]
MSWSESNIPAQDGRVAVITGANGGLGLATATALARKRAEIVIAARNLDKAEAAKTQILREAPGAAIDVVPLDLSSQESVKSAASEVLARHDRIDMLINNAGVMAMPEGRTADGYEVQLGTNHLGHWTWTAALLPAVLAADAGRVVTVTSVARHQGRSIDPANPFLEGRYDAWRAYGNSKLANLHFAIGLDRLFTDAGARATALSGHPGWTASDLQTTTAEAGGGGVLGTLGGVTTRFFGMSVPRGALSQLRAATDPSATGGTLYGPLFASFGSPVVRPLVRPGADEAIRRLWAVSEELTGVAIDVQA